MTVEIAKITYDCGLTDTIPLRVPWPSLQRTKWVEPFIPQLILESLQRERILELGGTWGDPEVGEPIQVDIIHIRGRRISTDITFYNRAISLLATESEEVKRIHRFCCALEGLNPYETKAQRPAGRQIRKLARPAPGTPRRRTRPAEG